jgi:hypothetical protein
MAAKAHEISLEAGSKMAAAMKDVVNAAAGLSGFVIESARDLVQYMVRRGQMTQEEADKHSPGRGASAKTQGVTAAGSCVASKSRTCPCARTVSCFAHIFARIFARAIGCARKAGGESSRENGEAGAKSSRKEGAGCEESSREESRPRQKSCARKEARRKEGSKVEAEVGRAAGRRSRAHSRARRNRFKKSHSIT